MKARENWELVMPPFRAVSQAPLSNQTALRRKIYNHELYSTS